MSNSKFLGKLDEFRACENCHYNNDNDDTCNVWPPKVEMTEDGFIECGMFEVKNQAEERTDIFRTINKIELDIDELRGQIGKMLNPHSQ